MPALDTTPIRTAANALGARLKTVFDNRITIEGSGVTAGTYNNSATQIRPFTVNSKGQITSVGTAVTLTPAWSNVTGKPTTLAGYGITDAIPSSQKGVANGVAALDSAGLIPANQLPSYVDDVMEFATLSAFPATGEASKIYVAADTSYTYRWSGSGYIWINGGSGSADSAVKLSVARTIAATGDASWSVNFDGSSNVSAALTLANTGVTAGTYNSSATAITPITFDAKGRAVSTGSAVTITPAWSNVTGKPTTLAGYGITDALKADGIVPTPVADYTSAAYTSSTVAANQVIDSVPSATYRSVKYIVQAVSGTKYQVVEIMLIHNGTVVQMSEYAFLCTETSPIATFDADISSGSLRLLATPANAVTEFKIVKTLIDV